MRKHDNNGEKLILSKHCFVAIYSILGSLKFRYRSPIRFQHEEKCVCLLHYWVFFQITTRTQIQTHKHTNTNGWTGRTITIVGRMMLLTRKHKGIWLYKFWNSIFNEYLTMDKMKMEGPTSDIESWWWGMQCANPPIRYAYCVSLSHAMHQIHPQQTFQMENVFL